MNPTLRPLLLALALAVGAPPTFAQTAPRTGTLGEGSSTGPLLPRDELRACLQRQETINRLRVAIVR